jgi:hypothetical protein
MNREFLLISVLFLSSLPLAAQIPPLHHVLYVDGVHGNDNNNCKTRKTACKTIGHAISLASPDDAILVAPATYYENLTINFNLGIIGSGASTTIIDGGQLDSVVTVPNNNTALVLSALTLRNGNSQNASGGGVANYGGIVTIFDSIISRNFAEYDGPESDGGGIYNTGTLTLDRSTVSENSVSGNYYSYGGGIYNGGNLTINDSIVSENSAITADAYGGGIYNSGTLVINRSTINGNLGGDGDIPEGGGIDNSGTAAVANSTLYGNEGFPGGGISNDSGTVTINNSTITGNAPYYAGGGIKNYASVTIQNSILANNNGGNCQGALTSEGYNLSSDNTCNLNGPGDLSNTQPELTPLQNNGGPTQTMGELPGSRTIDAGNPSGCTDGQGNLLTTDQRGAPRPGKFKHDKRCDMGAFEVQHD